MPIVEQDATDLLDAWAAFLEWQSDPTYKANPPSGYLLPGFDYMQAVADLRDSVTTGSITSEFDLHEGIRNIVFASNDGHMSIQTDFNNIFGWERQVALVSASADGQAVPQVWAFRKCPPWIAVLLLMYQATSHSSFKAPLRTILLQWCLLMAWMLLNI